MRLTVVALLAVFATPALAQDDQPRWFGDSYDTTAILGFGLPETDYAPLLFSCDAGTGEVMLSYEFEPVGATNVMEVTVTLQTADWIVPVKAKGIMLEEAGIFLLEGSIPFDDTFTALFPETGTLQVFVEDGSQEYDLAGANDAARALVDTCT